MITGEGSWPGDQTRFMTHNSMIHWSFVLCIVTFYIARVHHLLPCDSTCSLCVRALLQSLVNIMPLAFLHTNKPNFGVCRWIPSTMVFFTVLSDFVQSALPEQRRPCEQKNRSKMLSRLTLQLHHSLRVFKLIQIAAKLVLARRV